MSEQREPTDLPTVSVIIPTYNNAETLPRALDSVLMQEQAELDVIVVNDGSTDDTEAVLARYRPTVRVLSQPNAGPAAARNLALSNCRGEFVAFLDADDEWLPDRLAAGIAPALRTHAVGMTFCWAYLRRANGKQSVRNRRSPGHDLRHRLLWPNPMQCTPATTCRRSVLEAVGPFDETLRTREDLDLWIRMAEQCEVAEVRRPLVVTHENPNSYSFLHQLGALRRDYIRIVEKALDRAPDRYGDRDDQIRAEAHRYWGQFALYYGEFGRAREDLARSLDLDPRMSTYLLAGLARLPDTAIALLCRLYGWSQQRSL